MTTWKKLLLLVVSLSPTGCFREPATSAPAAQPAGASVASSPSSGTSRDVAATQADGEAMRAIPAGSDNSNLLLGNPSRAATDPNNYLVERAQHSMSYNKANGGPNWVAWHLEKSDLGAVRRGNFLPDPLLPPDMQIRPNDYRGSGYDRGHVCPSGDRTRTKTDNTATFVMSNMLPQAAALNQQVWKDLEDYSRSLTKSNELYTIAGGSGSADRIAGGKVNVPTVCWKIIVVLPRGDNDLRRINANTRIIAVSMPNRERQEIADSQWSQWITSVAQIEKTTGYDFLSALPDDVERALEQKVDSGRAPSAARETNDRGSEVASRTIQRGPPVSQEAPVQEAPRVAVAAPAYQEPAPQLAPQVAEQPAAAGQGQVWVNTNSGIYHYPGARWFGTTKQGAYMSEQEALAQGHRAARNGQ